MLKKYMTANLFGCADDVAGLAVWINPADITGLDELKGGTRVRMAGGPIHIVAEGHGQIATDHIGAVLESACVRALAGLDPSALGELLREVDALMDETVRDKLSVSDESGRHGVLDLGGLAAALRKLRGGKDV